MSILDDIRRHLAVAMGNYVVADAAVDRLPSSVLKTTNKGTAMISAQSQYVDVTHDVGYTPDVTDIVIVPTNALGEGASHWWITDVGATTFRINVDSSPETGTGTGTGTGVDTATFAWAVVNHV